MTPSSKEIAARLWVPTVIFKNTEHNFATSVDENSMILVKKEGNMSLSSIQEVEEIAYFSGSENPLIYSKNFYHRFQCLFDLNYYPFDTQLCTILLKKPNKVGKFAELLPNYLEYKGPKKMAEFNILKIEMKRTNRSNDFDIKVEIFLKRRISQHLLSTYLPSFCILCIAQVGTGLDWANLTNVTC